MACPISSFSTLSEMRASPTVQTIAPEIPWRALPATRKASEVPAHRRAVNAPTARRPRRRGILREVVLSASHPKIARAQIVRSEDRSQGFQGEYRRDPTARAAPYALKKIEVNF